MSKKKQSQFFEVGDETLKDVTGGQDKMTTDPTIPNIEMPPLLKDVPCPECNNMITVSPVNNPLGGTYLITQCPHCGKQVAVPV